MNRRFKILIVDDEDEINEITSFIFKSSLDCDVVVATKGEDAVAMISQGDIDLVVCDYNMPTMKGGEVYKFVLQSAPLCKYVMCSSDKPESHGEFNDRTSFYGYIQKPQIVAGCKAIVEKLKMELPGLNDADLYNPISIKLLFNISVMPSDVFQKLSKNKYVRVLNQNSLFDETDLIKYTQSGIEQLYTFNLTNDLFIDKIRETISKLSLVSKIAGSPDAILQIHSILVSTFKEYGFKEALLPEIEFHLKATLDLCQKNKNLSLLLKKLMKSKESYVGKHSFMLAAVNVAIAAKLTWTSETTAQKLVVASLFHDIFLNDELTNETKTLDDKTAEEPFLSHAFKAAELLDRMPNILPDTSRIVLEHHEVGEGLGVPRGMPISKTTPLSQVFTFSHYVVDLLLDTKHDEVFDKDAFFKKLEIICQRSDKYSKLVEVFRGIDFF